jgi:DNA primase
MAEILQALIEEDFGYKKEGRSWGRAEEHSSLVVNEETQKWFWNSENRGGDALAYLMLVRGLDKKSARELLGIREKLSLGTVNLAENIREYKPYEKLVDLLWDLGKGNRDYWYTRKLSDKTIDRYRLGFYDGWNLIPLYRGSEFVNFQCRRDEPAKRIKMWYRIPNWTPVLINSEMLNFVDKIYITEGPVDALLLNQEGIPAVSHTGGAGFWTADWYSLFYRVKTVYYICDNDDAGRAAGRRVAKALGENKTLLYQFTNAKEKYDTGDFFKEGGTAQEFKDMVEGGSKYLFELGGLK